MATSASREKVLSIYRRIQKISRTWDGPQKEKDYILAESRLLFRKNKGIQDKEKIGVKILEAESRIDLALHYKNPYPRVYQSYDVYGQDVGRKIIVPIYMVCILQIVG